MVKILGLNNEEWDHIKASTEIRKNKNVSVFTKGTRRLY